MPAALNDIFKIIESLAPPAMAESWDNIGLMLGDPNAVTDKAILTLDVNMDVARESKARGAGLIFSHHPLFIKPVKNIRLDSPGGKLIAFLIKNDIAIYTAHTNLDIVAGGVNDALAKKMGLTGLNVLNVTGCERYVKLVVFVPASHAGIVRDAVCAAGAGWIGNYSHCTFQTEGMGTFLPLDGTSPFTGSPGEMSSVEEMRLETIVPSVRADAVVQSMLEAHPYEEVAYDLYPLENTGPPRGLGRVGDLPGAVSLGEFAGMVKEALGLKRVRLGGALHETVRRIAVCGGSGAELYTGALAAGADVLVTGDVKYHVAQEMLSAGLKFIDAGHGGTERIVLPVLRDYLQEMCANRALKVEFLLAETATDPFKYF